MREKSSPLRDKASLTAADRGVTEGPDRPSARSVKREMTGKLFRELAQAPVGSVEHNELRGRLIQAHLPLAEHLARRFRNRGEPLEDLIQVANVGLLQSLDRFDPHRGVEFSTYATPTILGELKRYFRDKGWAIRVPRRLQELRMSLASASSELTQELGRAPTVNELASKVGVSSDDVLDGLEAANAYSTTSLDAPVDSADANGYAVLDTIGADDDALDSVEYRESLRPLLARLPEREKRIVMLRFFRGLTQSQIAAEVGLSQMHVSRLLARTLAKLRHDLLNT